ncbi:MAG TPA: SCO family protein [Alphaproteobacteria bacterium]|nr:SCO family protein [Alphaproteobacteria bacterium]
MNPQIKKRLVRTALFSLIALVIGAGVGWVQIQMQAARVTTKDGKQLDTIMPVAGLNIGGPFTLSDHTGAAVSEKTYAGKYKLIYFGFTYCPAICPTELQKMSRIISALEKNHPEALENVQPLFISVDPERDTVPVMREYVGLFHPRLVGLTGTTPQVDLVKKRYRVFASKVEDETNQDYTVDHSSFTYLMGPNDELIGMYRMKDTADQIYQDLAKRLGL